MLFEKFIFETAVNATSSPSAKYKCDSVYYDWSSCQKMEQLYHFRTDHHIQSDEDNGTRLHIATTLDHAQEVRMILCHDWRELHVQDSRGDQPTHIAARLGHSNCMRVLIEFDARMGRRNWAGLTPMGEARMNGRDEIVAMLKNNFLYTGNKNRGDNKQGGKAWDHDISSATSDWKEGWDDEKQVICWIREGRKGGKLEVSYFPPAADLHSLCRARDEMCERKVIRTIHPNSLSSQRATRDAHERRRQRKTQNQLERERKMQIEFVSSVQLQTLWRRRRAKRQRLRRQLEHDSARAIQVTWRWR